MIAGQTRGDMQESKSRLRRRRVDRDSSFQLDHRCLRTPPATLFHRHIFETALKMPHLKSKIEMRCSYCGARNHASGNLEFRFVSHSISVNLQYPFRASTLKP